jgi:hypothetical protein
MIRIREQAVNFFSQFFPPFYFADPACPKIGFFDRFSACFHGWKAIGKRSKG